MTKIKIHTDYLTRLAALDATVRELNTQKIQLIFEVVGLMITAEDLEKLLKWELILITVPDKQMAVQLNKLCAYIPNLKFVIDGTQPLFTLLQGDKSRRVWKER